MSSLSGKGELLLNLDFLESYERVLRHINRVEIGRPHMLTDRHVKLLTFALYYFVFLIGSWKDPLEI